MKEVEVRGREHALTKFYVRWTRFCVYFIPYPGLIPAKIVFPNRLWAIHTTNARAMPRYVDSAVSSTDGGEDDLSDDDMRTDSVPIAGIINDWRCSRPCEKRATDR